MPASWTYADWITQTNKADKLSRLKLHYQEVSQALAAPLSQSIDGMGYSRNQLGSYLEFLRKEISTLSAPMFTNVRVR